MDSIRDSYFNDMLNIAENYRDDYDAAGMMLNGLMQQAQNYDEYNLGFTVYNYMYAPANPID